MKQNTILAILILGCIAVAYASEVEVTRHRRGDNKKAPACPKSKQKAAKKALIEGDTKKAAAICSGKKAHSKKKNFSEDFFADMKTNVANAATATSGWLQAAFEVAKKAVKDCHKANGFAVPESPIAKKFYQADPVKPDAVAQKKIDDCVTQAKKAAEAASAAAKKLFHQGDEKKVVKKAASKAKEAAHKCADAKKKFYEAAPAKVVKKATNECAKKVVAAKKAIAKAKKMF